MNNRTTLVIAHRLSTIQKADQILVIEEEKLLSKASTKNCSIKRTLLRTLYLPNPHVTELYYF